MIKYFIYIIGIFLISIGFSFILINLNLLITGYTFFEYVKFIISSLYFYYIIIGIILIYISIIRKKGKR